MIEVSIEPRQLAAERDCELKIRFTNTDPGSCTDIVFSLGLPPEFYLLRGRDRIEIPELGPGEAWAQNLTVRARTAGDFRVTSANFSYRNEYGTPVRVPDFQTGITVGSAAASQPDRPDLAVSLASGVLAPGEWDVLRIRVRNESQSPLRGITLSVGGPVRIARPGPQAELPPLAAGQETEVTFIACPTQTGNSVPAQVRLTYEDGSGRVRSQSGVMPLMVRNPPTETVRTPRSAAVEPETVRTARRGAPARPDTILYLAASPTNLAPLRSDLEMREIHSCLQAGKHRDRFRLESAVAVRLKDIGQALADNDPRIVHFSGHGEVDGSLYVEDEQGYSVRATAEGLASLFREYAGTLQCVIVNACHSLRLAEAMARHIDHVIAMRTEILDVAAIQFSIGFYQGIAAGRPPPQAFPLGVALLQAKPEGRADYTIPVLLSRGKTAVS